MSFSLSCYGSAKTGNGIDTDQVVSAAGASTLAYDGVEWVGRYIEALTPAEIQNIHNAGMKVVLLFSKFTGTYWYSNQEPSPCGTGNCLATSGTLNWTSANGASDATYALSLVANLGVSPSPNIVVYNDIDECQSIASSSMTGQIVSDAVAYLSAWGAGLSQGGWGVGVYSHSTDLTVLHNNSATIKGWPFGTISLSPQGGEAIT